MFSARRRAKWWPCTFWGNHLGDAVQGKVEFGSFALTGPVSVPKPILVGKVYTSDQSLKSIRIVCVHSDGRVMAWFYN